MSQFGDGDDDDGDDDTRFEITLKYGLY